MMLRIGVGNFPPDAVQLNDFQRLCVRALRAVTCCCPLAASTLGTSMYLGHTDFSRAGNQLAIIMSFGISIVLQLVYDIQMQ